MQALPYVVVTKEGVAKVYEVRALPFGAPPLTHSLTARTFLSYIGQLSKSEEENFAQSRPPNLTKPARLRKYPPIETLDDNAGFCAFLREILDEQ